MDSPDQARTAVAVLTPLVHATPTSALTNPTPCDKWAVSDLLNHLVGGGHMFAAGFAATPSIGASERTICSVTIMSLPTTRRSPPSRPHSTTPPICRPRSRCRSRRSPPTWRLASLPRTLLVHAWDLATATGQQFDPPVEFVESVTPFYAEFISPPLRERGLFAAEVEVDAGATPLERLVALAGRRPAG